MTEILKILKGSHNKQIEHTPIPIQNAQRKDYLQRTYYQKCRHLPLISASQSGRIRTVLVANVKASWEWSPRAIPLNRWKFIPSIPPSRFTCLIAYWLGRITYGILYSWFCIWIPVESIIKCRFFFKNTHTHTEQLDRISSWI